MLKPPHLMIAAGAAAVGLAGLAAAPWYYQPRPLTRAMQRAWPGVLFEVDTERPQFALTFDDGPHSPYTEGVLDALAAHHARATFFVMGEQIERHPEVLERTLGEGHEAGNHFYDDRATWTMRDADILDSLERTEELLDRHDASLSLGATRLVRPASGIARRTTRDLLAERGYQIVVGSAYTSDVTMPPRPYMRWAFRQMLEPGRILILHDGRRNRQRTVDVLPSILEAAEGAGLEAVTVSELLAGARPAA